MAPILALTGPPGSGKTATLKVASREINFLIREWITPLNNNVVTEDFDVKDFLLRTSRFPSVLAGEQDRQSVVLMEDIPLTFLRDPGLLLEVLWEYEADGRSPLVMIIGDNKMFRKLLTDSIIGQLNIKVIE
ncbi:hypothetical protein B566_EDAN014943 [Ephemera danica]|nr:hypothetical protein B566_EDAN014943 [Ephemera danica]